MRNAQTDIGSKPQVAVVMTVYNGGAYLSEAVESILAQTFEDFVFIIVDDGSTDGTAAYLASLRDPRVQVLRQERAGQHKAAHRAISATSALQSNRPFIREAESANLWELPVTVMPFSRTPIHFSYLTYLASFSGSAAKAYFYKAMLLCRMTKTQPSLLLHPPDFMGCEDDSDMAFFPAMKMNRKSKLEIIRWALKLFADWFDVMTMIKQTDKLSFGFQ